MTIIPWALIWFRACAAFVPWFGAVFSAPEVIAASIVPLALLSDILDGKIARAQGSVTELLRRADGWADHLFVVSYTVYVAVFHFHTLAPWAGLILVLVVVRIGRAVLDFWKYGRGSAYHFYSAKAWGLAYYSLLFLILMGWPTEMAMVATLTLGFVNTVEGIIATLYIERWIYDAPHVVAAIKKGRIPPSAN